MRDVLSRVQHKLQQRITRAAYRGWRGGLVPVDWALSWGAKRSYALYRAWDLYGQLTDRFFEAETPNARQPCDAAVLAELRARGFAVAPTPFTDDEVAAAREFVLELFREAQKEADRRDPSGREAVVRWTHNDGIEREFQRLGGRARFHFSEEALGSGRLPPAVQRFSEMPEIRALVGAYFSTGTVLPRLPYYSAEVMWPCGGCESWHVDCLRRTLKSYLTLHDVTPETAPTRYIEGSHRIDEARHELFYRIARSGLGVSYFEPEDCARFDAAASHITAPRNRFVIFDNRGIHAGSVCRSGLRIILMNGYRPLASMRLNPRTFRDPDPQPYPWQRPGRTDPRLTGVMTSS